jgi:hypothetical protein
LQVLTALNSFSVPCSATLHSCFYKSRSAWHFSLSAPLG